MTRQRSPLEPAATWIYVSLALVGTLMALDVADAVFGSGDVFGIGGGSETCIEVRNGDVPVPQSGDNVVLGAENGVRSSTSAVWICDDSPAFGQRLLGTIEQLPSFLVFVGALLLAARLIRGATRDGIFTRSVAGRLRTLGWFVLAGELLASLLESQAENWLLNTMMADRDVMFWFSDEDIPLMAMFLGAVLISMARIMRISTTMREDLEGTV
jgi:hypothetical protein